MVSDVRVDVRPVAFSVVSSPGGAGVGSGVQGSSSFSLRAQLLLPQLYNSTGMLPRQDIPYFTLAFYLSLHQEIDTDRDYRIPYRLSACNVHKLRGPFQAVTTDFELSGGKCLSRVRLPPQGHCLRHCIAVKIHQ